jgi:hypothetical protein
MRVKKDAIGKEIVKSYAKGGAMFTCPIETSNVGLNLKNRNNTIKEYGYGPLNPDEPSEDFWRAKAKMWDTSKDEAKTARCGNCAAFIQTPAMIDCITKGINSGEEEEAEAEAEEEEEGEGMEVQVIAKANLGYCELFHFKCAGDRTCDAWLAGGPIK